MSSRNSRVAKPVTRHLSSSTVTRVARNAKDRPRGGRQRLFVHLWQLVIINEHAIVLGE